MFKFGNACVAIHNPVEFQKRINIALVARNRLTKLDRPFLTARLVTYYDPAQPAPIEIEIKNARDLAFVKQQKFADENEFRFVFGRRGAYELKQMLVNELYSPAEGLVGKSPKEVFLKIGSIRDIARQQT